MLHTNTVGDSERTKASLKPSCFLSLYLSLLLLLSNLSSLFMTVSLTDSPSPPLFILLSPGSALLSCLWLPHQGSNVMDQRDLWTVRHKDILGANSINQPSLS